jgi:enolase
MPNKIKKIHALEILDSRGNPTIQVSVELDSGSIGTAGVPSGASTGTHEALELRDGDAKRYDGKGVLKAVRNVNGEISRLLKGKSIAPLSKIDQAMIELDGTDNKSRLGANAILGVSLACAHAGAVSEHVPLYAYLRQLYQFGFKEYRLPRPMMNIINGGKHADSGLSFQEFMIMPSKARFADNLRMGAEIFHALGQVIKGRGYQMLVGDEGGYAPKLTSHAQVCEVIHEAIQRTAYVAGKDVLLGIDPAASELFDQKERRYVLQPEGTSLTSDQLIGLYEEWAGRYYLASVEDGLAEDDWDNWAVMTKKLGKKIMLIGDDLFVTNPKRLQLGIRKKVANAILIKVNQIGTLSETMACIKLAQKNNYRVVISHRSGETADTSIADLAVACNADFIKSGSLSRAERLSKYNRLLEIEEQLLHG